MLINKQETGTLPVHTNVYKHIYSNADKALLQFKHSKIFWLHFWCTYPNLDNSNADRIFRTHLMVPKISTIVHFQNITAFSNFDFLKTSIFQTILSVPIKEIPIKIPLEIQSCKLPITVTHNQLLHTRVISQVYSLQVTDIGLTVTLLGDVP